MRLEPRTLPRPELRLAPGRLSHVAAARNRPKATKARRTTTSPCAASNG
jgi:hypothetical protein